MRDDNINYNSDDLKSHDCVAGIIVDEMGRVLLQDHVKFNFWTFPSGKCKSGETLHDGLLNEMKEELDIDVGDYTLFGSFNRSYERKGSMVEVGFNLYEIKSYDGTIINNEPDKHRELRYFTIDEIINLPVDKTSHPLQFYLKELSGRNKDVE